MDPFDNHIYWTWYEVPETEYVNYLCKFYFDRDIKMVYSVFSLQKIFLISKGNGQTS